MKGGKIKMSEINFSDLLDLDANEEILDLPTLSVLQGASW